MSTGRRAIMTIIIIIISILIRSTTRPAIMTTMRRGENSLHRAQDYADVGFTIAPLMTVIH